MYIPFKWYFLDQYKQIKRNDNKTDNDNEKQIEEHTFKMQKDWLIFLFHCFFVFFSFCLHLHESVDRRARDLCAHFARRQNYLLLLLCSIKFFFIFYFFLDVIFVRTFLIGRVGLIVGYSWVVNK